MTGRPSVLWLFRAHFNLPKQGGGYALRAAGKHPTGRRRVIVKEKEKDKQKKRRERSGGGRHYRSGMSRRCL